MEGVKPWYNGVRYKMALKHNVQVERIYQSLTEIIEKQVPKEILEEILKIGVPFLTEWALAKMGTPPLKDPNKFT